VDKTIKKFLRTNSVILDSKITAARSHQHICFQYNQMHHPHQNDNLTGLFFVQLMTIYPCQCLLSYCHESSYADCQFIIYTWV